MFYMLLKEIDNIVVYFLENSFVFNIPIFNHQVQHRLIVVSLEER